MSLDMNIFHHALDRKGVTGDEYDDFIANLQIIEKTALRCIHKDN